MPRMRWTPISNGIGAKHTQSIMREILLPDGREIKVQEQFQLENEAGAVVWDAALVLAHFLIHCQGAASCAPLLDIQH
eukprot:366390-Chlamydomonas_euryale.AAC.30